MLVGSPSRLSKVATAYLLPFPPGPQNNPSWKERIHMSALTTLLLLKTRLRNPNRDSHQKLDLPLPPLLLCQTLPLPARYKMLIPLVRFIFCVYLDQVMISSSSETYATTHIPEISRLAVITSVSHSFYPLEANDSAKDYQKYGFTSL